MTVKKVSKTDGEQINGPGKLDDLNCGKQFSHCLKGSSTAFGLCVVTIRTGGDRPEKKVQSLRIGGHFIFTLTIFSLQKKHQNE